MPARYHLTSKYSLTSDREAVWVALMAVPEWPSWWRWARRIDVLTEPASDDGVGAVYRNQIGTPLVYGFTYTTEIVGVARPRLIDLTSSGDLVGRGRFLLSDALPGGTQVTFTWLVETPKWWMNLLAPVARPVFVWNHDRLMTDFGRGLARVSGGELTEVSNGVLSPQDAGFFEMPDST